VPKSKGIRRACKACLYEQKDRNPRSRVSLRKACCTGKRYAEDHKMNLRETGQKRERSGAEAAEINKQKILRSSGKLRSTIYKISFPRSSMSNWN
jgi:hypothetical protein